MNGDTTTYTYRAGSDKLAKRWHLASVETADHMFCGTRLAPDAEHGLKLDENLMLIDCGACKRTARFKTDVQKWGVDAPAAEVPAQRETKTRKAATRKTRTPKPLIDVVASEHEGDGGRQAPTKPAAKRRPSRASRNAELSAAAKAKRDAVDGAAVKVRDEVSGELTWRLIEEQAAPGSLDQAIAGAMADRDDEAAL
jgi:hypothetical protein